MKIIFLGLLFCEDSLQKAYGQVIGHVSMAPHIFQSNLIKGLENQEAAELAVCNIPPMGSFPIHNKALFSKTYTWGNGYSQIGYLNIPVWKQFVQEKKLYRAVSKLIEEPEETWLLLYSLYEPFLKAAKRLKKDNPGLRICLLHTDAVPGRNDMQQYMTRAAEKRGNRLVELARCCDKFIFLSKHLAEPMEVGDRPYMVVECICNEMQQESKITDGTNKVFLYTGSLNREYGICELADAFAQLPDAQLWVCGGGEAETYLKDMEKQYINIRFLGFQTQEQLAGIRDRCDYLINPRQPTGSYTKYSFPSKTVEYMLSGKPVVMYKLEAIPDEYDLYLNYLHEESPKQMADELRRLINADYTQLSQKAEHGRRFVLEQKSGNKQALKILDFLEEE